MQRNLERWAGDSPLKRVLYSVNMKLDEEVYNAFSSVPKPNYDQITPHRCLECDEIRDEFSKYSVRDLPAEVVKANHSSLPLLSSEALRYYLPRYIDHALSTSNDDVAQFLLFELTPKDGNEPQEERLRVFSPEERAVISRFLGFIEKDFSNVNREDFEVGKVRWAV